MAAWNEQMQTSSKILNKNHEQGFQISLTLARFVDGPAKGVPSLFSLTLGIGTDSSRTGLTFRSAYLRQLVPQVSHRMFVDNPLGAFHQVFDSRVRHAPQLGVLEGCAMMDELSSERPTC